MAMLDTTKAFDGIWHAWTITGVNPSKINRIIYILYSLFVAIVVVIMGTLNFVVEIFLIEDFKMLMMLIPVNLELVCIVLRTVCLYVFRDTLLEANGYLSKLDQCAEENAADRNRMDRVRRNSIRLSRYIINGYVANYMCYVIHAALTGNIVLAGWFPFDWRSSTALYIVATTYQTFYTFYLTVILAGADAFMILSIYILRGHIECLMRRISIIGYPDVRVKCSPEENYDELVKCINYHRNSQRYLECLYSMISGTFLIQIMATTIISSNMISAIVLSEDITFVLKSFLFTAAKMLQLLTSCYLVSHMTEESSQLTTAIYSCNWMDQDVKFRRTIILFMQRSQQPNEIIAGSMISISLPTFVRLIKMSYSLYTLLSSY